MIARARLLAVVSIVLAGAIGVVSSTQTWLTVVLDDGAEHALPVPGASAIPVLAPLSLAVLALGGALSVVGPVLRVVFGLLTVGIAAVLGVLTAQVAWSAPVSAVAATVTASTGITGLDAVAALVLRIEATAWPWLTLLAEVVLLAAGVFTLATARRWKGSGRRYRTDDVAASVVPTARAESGPRDAVDSWDDLSRGDDPTAR